MKAISRLFILSFVLLTAASTASASIYVAGLYNFYRTDFGSANGPGIRVGTKVAPLHSFELELLSTRFNERQTVEFGNIDIEGEAKVDILIGLINYRFTYPFTDRFSFYAGGGLGGTYLKADVRTNRGDGDARDGLFTLNLFLGGEFYIIPELSVAAGYRRLMLDDVRISERGIDLTIKTGNANVFEVFATYYF